MKKKESTFLRFLKSTLIFFMGTVLSKLITILLLPLYTSHIPTDNMGYYDLSLTYITVGTSILFIDIWVAILRYMYDCKSDNEKGNVIKSGFVIFLMSSVLFILVGIVCTIVFHIENAPLIFLYGFVHNLSTFFSYCARGYGKNIDFSISGILNTLFNVVSNLVFILILKRGYEALYISSVIGYLAQILYLSLRTRTLYAIMTAEIDKNVVRSMFRYSLPLCVNSVAYWLLTSFNRTVVNWIHGNSMNGLLAIGAKFGMLIALVTTCFTLAWQDIAFSTEVSITEDKRGQFYSNACNAYSQVLLFAMGLLLPFVNVIFPYVVKGSYRDAFNTIPLFLIVAIVSAISTFIGNVFYSIKETKAIFRSMVVSSAVNLAICYPLILYFSINGSNLAVIIGFLVNIVIRIVILKNKVGFKFDFTIFRYLLVVAAATVVYLFGNTSANIACFVVIAAFMLLVYREYIRNFITRIHHKNVRS